MLRDPNRYKREHRAESKILTAAQAEYLVLSEEQLKDKQRELTETTQAVLNLDDGSAAHVLRYCNWCDF